MSVYLLTVVDIPDREAYSTYQRGFMKIFRKHPGKILSLEETPIVKEGTWSHTRTVLVEFPSMEEFDLWYHGEEYQALAQHRKNVATSSVVVLREFKPG